tara:strand:- start:40 stop:717 length:678 start_codon:yes stop_codon:yes gene_type:complete
MRIGIITYDAPHLKTEQVVTNLAMDEQVKDISIFALPYLERKKREVIFNHRPNQNLGTQTENLKNIGKVSFHKWSGKEVIADFVDIFIITGAGILDIKFAKEKPVINAHPGIIPTSRGLDSFKWTIFNNDPLGISLHLIDQEVDKGKILIIKKTPIFSQDTIESLAKRHYELEIFMLSNALNYLQKKESRKYKEKPARLRMPADKEKHMLRLFEEWKKNQLNSEF